MIKEPKLELRLQRYSTFFHLHWTDVSDYARWKHIPTYTFLNYTRSWGKGLGNCTLPDLMDHCSFIIVKQSPKFSWLEYPTLSLSFLHGINSTHIPLLCFVTLLHYCFMTDGDFDMPSANISSHRVAYRSQEDGQGDTDNYWTKKTSFITAIWSTHKCLQRHNFTNIYNHLSCQIWSMVFQREKIDCPTLTYFTIILWTTQ